VQTSRTQAPHPRTGQFRSCPPAEPVCHSLRRLRPLSLAAPAAAARRLTHHLVLADKTQVRRPNNEHIAKESEPFRSVIARAVRKKAGSPEPAPRALWVLPQLIRHEDTELNLALALSLLPSAQACSRCSWKERSPATTRQLRARQALRAAIEAGRGPPEERHERELQQHPAERVGARAVSGTSDAKPLISTRGSRTRGGDYQGKPVRRCADRGPS